MWSMTGGAEWSTGSRRVCGSYVDGTIGCVVCVECGGLTLGLNMEGSMYVSGKFVWRKVF